MKNIILGLLAIFISSGTFAIAEEKILIMGYKVKAKMPLIGGKNDDSGLYKTLFEKAANKIGYQLKIVRLPKKRIHKRLMDGTIDFYPGASFSQKRSKYLYYLPNGLETKEVLISLNNQSKINNLSEAKGRLLVELGSSKVDWDKKYPNLKIVKLNKLPMPTVIKALKKGIGDFYIADIEIVDYYKKINNIKSYNDIGLEIHANAIDKKYVKMYLGFSRKSPKFQEQKNSNYNNTEVITIKNFPTSISTDCVAYKFYLALEELKKDGETKVFYDKYFK